MATANEKVVALEVGIGEVKKTHKGELLDLKNELKAELKSHQKSALDLKAEAKNQKKIVADIKKEAQEAVADLRQGRSEGESGACMMLP